MNECKPLPPPPTCSPTTATAGSDAIRTRAACTHRADAVAQGRTTLYLSSWHLTRFVPETTERRKDRGIKTRVDDVAGAVRLTLT